MMQRLLHAETGTLSGAQLASSEVLLVQAATAAACVLLHPLCLVDVYTVVHKPT